MKLPGIAKNAAWKALFVLSPNWYEREKSQRLGFAYPEYFDITRSIFVHVPKAAGTSISLAIYGRQIDSHPWPAWYDLNPRKFGSYYKFAVIREPISRFVSAFSFLKRGGLNDWDKSFAEKTLKPYDDPNQLAMALIDGHVQNAILQWEHFRPQVEYVADANGRSKMDLLFRFEDLEAGFELVCHKLGLERKLPRFNNGQSKASPLNEDALEVLRCIYRSDLALYREIRPIQKTINGE